MAIQQWTMDQWRLIHEMVQSNEWKLNRFIDKDNDNQINVSLYVFGQWNLVQEYRQAFGGRTAQNFMERLLHRKGILHSFTWLLRGRELDDFLDNIWILLSKVDPHGRLTDVRQSQDIRRRVREGRSYPFYDPRSAKRR